jgi:hypothetical protein
MKKYLDNLRRHAEENPLGAAAIAIAAIAALTKLMQANTERNNSKTWSKEVDRRRMMNTK